MNIKLLAIFCLALALTSPLFADKPKPPTDYNTYDGGAPGGSALAMGYAYSTVGGDPSSVFFNPAGISFLKESVFGVS